MKALFLLALSAGLSAQMVPWTTRAFHNNRDGWFDQETRFTQDSIARNGLRISATIPLYGQFGDARGAEAQPLLYPGVKIAAGPRAGETHDVLLTVTMSGDLRIDDAHTGASLFELQIGYPVSGSGKIDMHLINQRWSCLSTGVIVFPTAYLSCWNSPDKTGNPATARYMMYGVNLTTGQQVFAPVNLQGTDTGIWKQRASLTFVPWIGSKGSILIPHGSVYETSTGYTGGITTFDVATNKVVHQLRMPEGIWQAGSGLACDDKSMCLALTANGDFDPSKGFYGESFIRLRWNATSKALYIDDDWS
jgi:hypothetical protein